MLDERDKSQTAGRDASLSPRREPASRKPGRFGVPAALIALALGGCAGVPVAHVPSVFGTYAGVGPGGEAIVLDLEQDGQAFRGQGTMAGQPVAIAGLVTWSAVASVVHANGAVSLRRLSLDLDGETLLLEADAAEPIVLARTGDASPSAPGPFTGTFASAATRAGLVEATLVQSGEMLSGTGIVLDRAIGIGGRVVEPGKAEGVAIFADESGVRFRLELAADGRSLRLLGLGEPLTLRRQ